MPRPDNFIEEPLVIGGTGGSGTRVVARLARHAGYFLGSEVTDAEDALAFRGLYDRWIPPWLAPAENALPDGRRRQMEDDLQACLRRHRLGIPDPTMRWGWKNPRSIYLLPFLHLHYPRMRFIQVVRDGRDMAYSRNQNQVKSYARALLGRDQKTKYARALPGRQERKLSRRLRAVALWSVVNMRAASYGEGRMGASYLRLRLEDLCLRPAQTIGQVFDFLEAPDADLSAALAEVRRPGSLQRWKGECPEEVAQMARVGRAALERFGYSEDGT